MRSAIGSLAGHAARKILSNSAATQNRPKTVYLTHVKWVTGSEQLKQYFSKYGPVERVNMFFDPDTGLHRGFASLTFTDPESVASAMQHRPHVIDGDRVDVELFVPMKSKKKDAIF